MHENGLFHPMECTDGIAGKTRPVYTDMKTGEAPRSPFISRRQLAERWLFTERNIIHLENQGIIAAVRIGRSVRYRIADVLAVESNFAGTTKAAPAATAQAAEGGANAAL